MAFLWPFLALASGLVLEDLESYKKGETPEEGWKSRGGKPKEVYLVEKEGQNQFLRAKDQGQSVQYFRKKGWDISEQPLLTWRWRVHQFPAGSDERLREKNDSAAAVYVVFPRRFFVPESIKYVWSEKVPEGSIIRHSRRFPTIVVRSGPKERGKWVMETRNVYQDYFKLFKRYPGDPVAIGFLTDANAVGGSAEADYDDLTVKQIESPTEEETTTSPLEPAD